MSKLKTVWKTREVGKDLLMICQNSNPELGKYPEWGPEFGVCENWVKIGRESVAVICSDCFQRSLRV